MEHTGRYLTWAGAHQYAVGRVRFLEVVVVEIHAYLRNETRFLLNDEMLLIWKKGPGVNGFLDIFGARPVWLFSTKMMRPIDPIGPHDAT
jgi:hypothetical protein